MKVNGEIQKTKLNGSRRKLENSKIKKCSEAAKGRIKKIEEENK